MPYTPRTIRVLLVWNSTICAYPALKPNDKFNIKRSTLE